MPIASQPATPEQLRLLFGLSSLAALPMVAIVMVYLTAHETVAEFVRFVPLFGGSPPSQPLRSALAILVPVFPIVVVAIGRLAHEAIPVTMGLVAGTDAVLASVLLMRSLRGRQPNRNA